MTISDPTAPIHDSDPPPFHQLDWPRFERLVVDLFQEEDGISYSELHGTPGPQTDYGVDVIARRADGSGIEIGSCKRYQSATAANIAKWSTEMLDHWDDRWSKRNVRRFVLATSATNLAKIDIQDQIDLEVERFAQLGVRYEVWGPAQLVRKLRPHRLLTAGYLKEHWANSICGPATMPAGPVSSSPSLLSSGAVAQLAELQALLSGEVSKRVEAALSDLRQGDYSAVRRFADEMHASDRWSQLTPQAQAMILRLEGSLALSEDDIDTAQAKSDLADACHAPDEPRLIARIAAERDGAEAGIAVLGDPTSISGRQLLAAMLLSTRAATEAREILLALDEEAPNDPETLRLLALERLGANQRLEALALIQKAEALAGPWLALLRNGATVRYALALSPILDSTWLLVPNPIDGDLVLTDEDAQGHLAAALQQLDAIPASLVTRDDRQWRLAILSNTRGRHREAGDLAREILGEQPGEPMVVAWSLMRGYEIDLEASRMALRSAYEQGADIPAVKVLAMLLAQAGDPLGAADFLEQNLARQDEASAAEAKLYIARFRGEGEDQASEAVRKAQDDGDWDDAEALFSESLESDPPKPFALSIAELAASEGRFAILNRHRDRLIAFGTANAIRLAIYAALNCGDHKEALILLDTHARAFGNALPADLQRLKAEALARAGDLRGALQTAARLAADGRLVDQLFEAQIRARLGSISQSVPLIRRALSEGALTSTGALQWSQVLRRDAPDLARDLLRSALASGIEEDQVYAAFGQSIDLGLGEERHRLMPKIIERAAAGDPRIVTFDIDEAKTFIQNLVEDGERIGALYRSGAIPSHLYARGDEPTLLRLHLGLNRVDHPGILEPRLIRHGARPLDLTFAGSWNDWHIHLDVSGLLEAYRAGLLDKLEAHPNGLTISSHLPSVLLQMRLTVSGGDHEEADALQKAIGCIDAGLIDVVDWLVPAEQAVELDADQDSDVPTLSKIVGPLVSEGILTRSEAAALVGTDIAPAGANQPLPTTITLSLGAFIRMAATDVLERIAIAKSVRVESAVIAQIRAQILRLDANAKLSAMATALSQRVGDGVAAGNYKLLPAREGLGAGKLDDGSLLEQQLGDLLSVPPRDGAVVWFDDRNLSGYVHAGTLPIIGITDAVQAMAQQSVLNAAEASQIRSALRTSGAFIPFTLEEIVEPLLQAPIIDGRLTETPTLRSFRRAFAANRSMEPDIKIGPVPGLLNDRPDEDLIARSTMRMFSDSLEAVWTATDGTIEARMARSDWLLSAVRVHRLNREPPATDVDAARLQFEAVEIGHCLDKAWDIGRDKTRRLNYLHWCWQRLVVPRLYGRPSVLETVSDYLVTFYRNILRDHRPKSVGDRLIYERLLLARVQRLPTPMAERIRSAGVFDRLVKIVAVITISKRSVEAGRFWRAVRTAIRYGSAKTRTTDGRSVRLHWTAQDGLVFTGGIRATIDREVPLIVAARADDRMPALRRFAQRLDLSALDADAFVQKAANIRESHRLAAFLNEARHISVAMCREEVDRSLSGRRGADRRDLEPQSVERLLWHYRINPDASGVENWAQLEARYGPADAYLMLAAFPAQRPNPATLSSATVDEIVAKARTPLALAIAGGLARRCGRPPEQLAAIARRFLAATTHAGDLFCAILRWTWIRWHQDADCVASPTRTTLPLAWAHADWLTEAFLRHNFDISEIADSFPTDALNLDPLTYHSLQPTGYVDQADPAITTAAVLLHHGLAEILGDLTISEVLTTEEVANIDLQLAADDQQSMAVADLIMRRPENSDALGGLLTNVPHGLFGGQSVAIARDALIDFALDQVIADPVDREVWQILVGAAVRGLNEAQIDRLRDLVHAVDLFALVYPFDETSQAIWRGIIGPLAWHGDDVSRYIAALSRRCSHAFGSNIGKGSQGEAALGELIEAVLNASRAGTSELNEARLCDLLWRLVEGWPQSASQLRQMGHHILDALSPTRFPGLWSLVGKLDRLP